MEDLLYHTNAMDPPVPQACVERFSATAKPREAAVYENLLYAAEAAKKAASHTVGIYEESTNRHRGLLTALADETIRTD